MIEIFIKENGDIETRGGLIPGQKIRIHKGAETWIFQRLGEKTILLKKEKKDVKAR